MTCRHLLIIIALAALSIFGCTNLENQDVRAGKDIVLAGNSVEGHWWNHYERGRSFANGKLYKEAIADFKKAIEGRGTDQWRTPAADMRRMDYFPHREMGIVYFQRKEYDEALSALKLSIQTAPSAKGHYFLNKARAAKLRAGERDMAPPTVYLDGSSGSRLTNDFMATVKGVAADDTSIAAIRVGDIQVPFELAEKQRVFTVEVPLKEGENVIRIMTTDLLAKTAALDLEILCDRSGPLIEVLQVSGEGKNKVVNGVVSDNGGLKSLKVNGKPWKITGESSAYNFKFALPESGVTLFAADRSGNVTRASVGEDGRKDDPLMHPRSALPESPFEDHSFPTIAADAHTPLFSSLQAPPADTDPPFIDLEGLGPDEETFDDNILLKMIIADFSPIQTVSVNGTTIPNKNGRKIFFSQQKKLAEGNNEFRIVAVDTFGNRAEKSIIIHHRVQNIRQLGSRLSVAVLPLDQHGSTSMIGERIYDQLIDSLREQKRFNIVEQSTMNAVMQKLMLSRTDLIDQDKAIEFGRMIAADAILVGDIFESTDSVEIIARLFDTATSTMLAGNDIFGEDKSDASLGDLLDSLAMKFKRNFPIIEGMVTGINNDEAVIDIGVKAQIKPGQHFICYRKGMEIKHPVTGKIADGEPEILGHLTIKEVLENFSRASIQKQKGEVRIYDQVIAR